MFQTLNPKKANIDTKLEMENAEQSCRISSESQLCNLLHEIIPAL